MTPYGDEVRAGDLSNLLFKFFDLIPNIVSPSLMMVSSLQVSETHPPTHYKLTKIFQKS